MPKKEVLLQSIVCSDLYKIIKSRVKIAILRERKVNSDLICNIKVILTHVHTKEKSYDK